MAGGDFDYESLMRQTPAATPPADTAPDDQNPYLEMMQGYKDANQQAAQGTIAINADANPDHAARAAELSTTLGIPPAIIESDLPTFEARAKAIHDNAVIASNPMLASWVANNREAARQAQDDFDQLGFVEKTLTALQSGGTAAIEQNQLGRLYNVKQVADTLGLATPDTDKEIAQVEGQLQRQPELSGGYGLLQHMSGFGFGLLDNFLSSAPEMVGGAGLGFATSGPPGAAVGAVAGAGIGFKLDMARVSAGLNYRATQYVRSADGQPLSQDARQVGALVTGLLTYALAGIGTSQAKDLSQEALGQLTSEAVKRAMMRPTVTAAMKTLSKSIVKGGATGAAFMGGMEATNILGEELAKELTPGDFATVLNDPAQRELAIERIANAAESGAVTFGILHSLTGTVGLAGDLIRARQAEHDVQLLKAVQDGSGASQLRGRNRQAFAAFLQGQTEGSPVENLYLPVEKILTLYQGARIDPNVPRVQDPLFGWVKDMPEQIRQAQAAGGDIVIPTSDYLAHLAGTDIGNGLLHDVRVRPDAMSLNEAKAFMDTYRETLGKAGKEALGAQEAQGVAIDDPADRVYQKTLQMAQAAGYGPNQAHQYASLYAARYSARAARLGIDPWEAFARSGIEIQGDGVKQNASREIAPEGELATQAIQTFNQEPVPRQFGDTTQGAALTLTPNTTPGEGSWRVTHWLDGQPVRHVPFEDYLAALRDFTRSAQSEAKYRRFFQQERGAITFTQGRTIINLFKGRDLSTLLHETSHLWLEELKADAMRPDAPAQLKQDLATALKWMGAEGAEKITTAQHEQFARAGEAYFMEGKAPSAELASVFQRFKSWLTHIYRTLAGLNTPINDEIRGVFDRLLATDDEIEHAQRAIGVLSDQAAQKFRDRLSGLMTKAEFAAYLKAITDAQTEANQALLPKMMEKIRRERKADYRAEREQLLPEVSAEVDARPEIQALQFSPKLDRKIIEKIYGGNPAMMYFIPRQLLAKEGGVHPDHAAEMFGFPSGDALIKALIALEQQKRQFDLETGKVQGIRQHLIDQALNAKLDEKHGDLMQDGNIEAEALAAVHNRAQEEALATELRVLGRAGAQPPIPLELAREWATTAISERKVRDVGALSRFARAEAKSARAAEAALLAGKPDEAYQHKRQQILNHLLYTAAQDANHDIERGQKLMQRLAEAPVHKSLDQEYTDRLHELLGRFGLRVARTPDELARATAGETLEGFARRKFDEGYELAIDPMFYDPQLHGALEDLTVNQFRALHDAVKSLQAVGRDENTIQIGGERTDREVAVAQMVSHLQALPQKKPSDWYRPENAGTLAKIKERTLGFLRSADASLMKEEQLLDWFDGNDPSGPFNRYIFRPLKEAQLRADDMRRRVAKQIQDIIAGMPKAWSKDLTDALPNDTLLNPKTGNPMKLRRREMLSMALNVGNADNAAKLADGYGWSEPAVMAFLHEHMRAEDWQFVQKMWDVVGQFRPDIDALQRRVTGVGLEFVQPRTVQTKYGEIPGGYFPIVYDPLRSPEAERHLAKAATEMFENQYYRATTPKGFTIKRVQGVQRPIALDLDVLPWKVGQVIHDLAFREAIMNGGKLLADKRVLQGIDDAFGHEYTKTLRPWLQSIANSRNINDSAADWIDKSLRWMRSNATMVGIGFRLSTMYKHGMTALSNSVGELGAKWMLRGTREFFGTPEQMQRAYRFVMDSSGEMRNRLDHYDRDIRDNLKTLLDEHGFGAEAKRYGAYGVSMLDLGSALPTWLGAYRKAMASEAEGGLGLGHEDAVYYADKIVRKAHGSQGLVDFAAIQRGPEFQKLLTMFYGFFNHIYNRQRDIVRQGRLAAGKARAGDYAGARRDFALVLARSMTYLVVPAIVESLYTTGGPNQKEEETWGHWVAHSILAEIPAGIPIVRDIAKSALEGRDYEYSPIVRAVSTVVGTGKDIGSALGLREQEPSKKWLRHAIETAGYVTGLPTGQVGTSGQFLWDVVDGEQQPQDVYDWYRGLSFGKIKKE